MSDLGPYWGEFLISPIPLELSLNYCSHGCHYCFANLNEPDRTANAPATMRLLADFRNRTTLPAKLMQAGFPVLVSNRVDPLAASNDKQALPMIETMVAAGIPVTIQTKVGKQWRRLLDILKGTSSVFYVSVSMMDDALRQAIEPGAPSIESRFDFMRTCTAEGHRVVLGLNPYVPEWLENRDPTALLTAAREAGATGVWVGGLHFSHLQEPKIRPEGRAAMGEDLVQMSTTRGGQRHRATPGVMMAHNAMLRACESLGLAVFLVGQWTPSTFFDPYRASYARTFPVMQDWVNWCHENCGDGDILSFTDFWNVMGPRFPADVPGAPDYIKVIARQVQRTHALPTKMTWKQVCALIWNDERIRTSPARIRCFAFASVKHEDEAGKVSWEPYMDEADGQSLYLFRPNGTDDTFEEIFEEPLTPKQQAEEERIFDELEAQGLIPAIPDDEPEPEPAPTPKATPGTALPFVLVHYDDADQSRDGARYATLEDAQHEGRVVLARDMDVARVVVMKGTRTRRVVDELVRSQEVPAG